MKTILFSFFHTRAVPLLLFFGLLTLYPAAVRADWDIQKVDTKDNVGKYSSIAVDGSNRIHISYFSDTKGELKYAEKDANSPWVTAVIDKSADAGLFTSIGIGKYVHISYYNASNTKLRYADNARLAGSQNGLGQGAWQTQDIDVAHNVGQFTSLAIDRDESIHITYYDAYEHALKYATNAGGSWQVETVDDSGNVGTRSSIGIDSSGRVHVSYYDVANQCLKYAVRDSSGWQSSTLDNTGNVGIFNALALDSADGVHIAYEDTRNGNLKYAAKTVDGSWQLSTIDGSGAVGGHIAIAVDKRNKVHLSYYDGANGDLRYATDMSGSWVTEAVDTTDDVGQFTAIAVGPDRNIHISYHDATQGDLKYAERKNPVSSVFPASVTFDSTAVGSTSIPQTLTVTNKGTGTLQIGLIGADGTSAEEFSLIAEADRCSNSTLAPMETCTVAVAFAPETAGDKTAVVVFPSNDPETPTLKIPLSSTATAQFHITASAGAGGVIAPSGTLDLGQGATQTFTMEPANGFHVADLLVDGVSVGALTRYDFSDIEADHTIEVVFASTVRIAGEAPVYYPSFMDVYSAVDDSGTIQYQAVEVPGDLLFDRPVSVILQGGYNLDFTAADSFTVVNGSVVIEDGTLTVENLEIR